MDLGQMARRLEQAYAQTAIGPQVYETAGGLAVVAMEARREVEVLTPHVGKLAQFHEGAAVIRSELGSVGHALARMAVGNIDKANRQAEVVRKVLGDIDNVYTMLGRIAEAASSFRVAHESQVASRRGAGAYLRQAGIASSLVRDLDP